MTKRTTHALCAAIGVLAVLFALLLLSGYPEGYCYLYPSIDTKYASGFSEQSFRRLQVGMTRTQAEKIMCAPLSTWTDGSGLVTVSWTEDGNAPFGDFAWFGRGIKVRNGTIVEVVSEIYYD